MHILCLFVLSIALAPRVDAVVIRHAAAVHVQSSPNHFLSAKRSHDADRLGITKAYVITDHQTFAEKNIWASNFSGVFANYAFIDPVYLQEDDLRNMLRNGTIDPHYKSWYVGGGGGGPSWNSDPKNLSANWKFPHELGCTLAHRHAWHRFVDEYEKGMVAPWAAFFEGDTIFRSDFVQRAKTLLSRLPTLPPWDVIYMGHCFETCVSPQSYAAVYIGADVHVEKANHPACTHSYLLSAAAAQRLLKLTVPMKQALDETVRSAYQSGNIDSLSVCPSITRQPWQKEDEVDRPSSFYMLTKDKHRSR